jgi:hypothetical protein
VAAESAGASFALEHADAGKTSISSEQKAALLDIIGGR